MSRSLFSAGLVGRLVAGASLTTMALCTVVSPARAQSSASAYTTGYRYDAERRLVGTISPDPDPTSNARFGAIRYTYDVDGKLVTMERGVLTTWQSETVLPMNWTAFSVIATTAYAYDPAGNKVEERLTTAAGGSATQSVTQASYDADDRLTCTAVRMSLNAIPATGSDACAQSTGSTGPDPDRIERAVYDAADQLVQTRRAVGTGLEQGYATYAYTGNGKRSDVIDADGNRAHLTYDGFDRQALWQFPSATAPTGYDGSTQASALASAGAVNAGDYEQYSYDADGNRTGWRKRDGRVFGYTFDALNRMTSKLVPDGCPSIGSGACPAAAATRDVFYGYDLRGLQLYARFDNTSGEGIANSYDGAGELTGTTSTMGGVTRTLAHQFDADGNRTRITHADGVYFDMSFDGLDRMNAARWWTAAGGTVPFYGIAYDDLGRRTTTARASSSTGYSYDAALRLSGVSQVFAGNAGNATDELGYNAAGQITQQTRDNDAFAYTGAVNANKGYATNGLNQYTGVGSATLAYDANGNLTNDGTTSYQYDAENRLIGTSSGFTLSYDPLGRLSRTAGGAFGASRFLYDGDQMVAEYDDDTGAMRRRFMFGPNGDEPVLWDEGSALNCSETKVLHTDHQNSIVAAADCSGNRTNINAYDEYGTPASANVGRFGYTGQMWLPEAGLWHYKARVYSPQLGRFLQTDPVGYDDHVNLYAYVANDPVNHTDPTGNESVWGSISNWASDEWTNLKTQAARIPDDLRTLPEAIVNGTTGLPPTLTAEVNVVSAPIQAVSALRMSVAMRASVRLEARAASLAARAGGNSVTVRTAGGFSRVDLAGKAHFSKELGRYVSTPHVQSYRENIVDGVVKSVTKIGDAVPATLKDLRAAEDVLKNAGK